MRSPSRGVSLELRREIPGRAGHAVFVRATVDGRGAIPSGNPVKPPRPNIGRKASANSIGVVKRIDPPHNDRNRHVRITTEGIEIRIVVVWKKALIEVPIPVMNM